MGGRQQASFVSTISRERTRWWSDAQVSVLHMCAGASAASRRREALKPGSWQLDGPPQGGDRTGHHNIVTAHHGLR
jgi:hypothetical protein